MNWLSAQWNNVAESSLLRKNKESNIRRFDFLTFANIKVRKNSGRPFDSSAVRKQYWVEKISVHDFSAIRRDGRFTFRPYAISPRQSKQKRHAMKSVSRARTLLSGHEKKRNSCLKFSFHFHYLSKHNVGPYIVCDH